MPPIPNHIRRFRTAHGVKGKDLAEKLGVDNSTLSKWETHTNDVPDEFKVAIAKEFDVPVTAIFQYEFDVTAEALRRLLDLVAGHQERIETLEAGIRNLKTEARVA